MRRAIGVVLAAAGAVGVGCSSRGDRVNAAVETAATLGIYGPAREKLQDRLPTDPGDRAYILDRLRLLILTLADGQPDAAESVANETYALLRTQGLNADRTVSSVVFNERVKIWKGEPFEQALAYSYIAMQKAQRGEWDNARAAAQSSLFLLKDFGTNERGEPMTGEDLARRAAQAEQRGRNGDEVIDHGYTPIKTDFALGYVLNGIANRALGRDDEAADNFREAGAVRPGLAPLAEHLRTGAYNTVFIVDYGQGPRKVAYGPDDALVRFAPVWRSDDRALAVMVSGGDPPPAGVPAACDVNDMGARLAWNNLEDVREAKSTIGSLLLVGGVAVATVPQGSHESDNARRNRALIGAGVAILGAIMKATASADTRHCEFLPQRTFVVPVQIDRPGATVVMEVPGDAGSRVVLPGIDPPDARFGKVQLRYVRLTPSVTPWQGAGRVVYANEAWREPVPGDDLPYIFGGRDASRPNPAATERYHRAGRLRDLTTADLENLCREEGLTLSLEDQGGKSRAHVLEGGTSLVPPMIGTAGYMRLFGQEHGAYVPRSEALRRAVQRERGEDPNDVRAPNAQGAGAKP
jgi:hypothetical protein